MEQNALLGSSLVTFLLFTCIFGGFLAFMTGNALAKTWRSMWQVVPYGILLGAAERFFVFALFGGQLLSVSGFLVDTALILVITFASYRATLVRNVVLQYPWYFERSGLFGWRKKGA